MSSLRQIEANRINSQASTGPRTTQGKAVSRFNHLKTGIDAKSLVIPGEDPDAFEALLDEYYIRFQPANVEEIALLDTVAHSDWQLRRLRKADAQIWQSQLEGHHDVHPLHDAYYRDRDLFSRLQRRIDSTDRAFHRALRELKRCQAERLAEIDEPAQTPALQSDPLPEPASIGFVPTPIPTPLQSASRCHSNLTGNVPIGYSESTLRRQKPL